MGRTWEEMREGKPLSEYIVLKNLTVRATLDMLCFLKEVTAETQRT